MTCRPVSTAAEAAKTSEESAKLMMALFMGSWSLGFVALFAAHLYLRLDAVSWPPAGAPPPPRVLTGVATALALLSSGAYHWGLRGIERGERRTLTRGLALATLLTFLFVLTQVAGGAQAVARGLTWEAGVYGAFFWIVGGFHLAHVMVGFVAGAWLSARAAGGAFTADGHLAVRMWGYYWHTIGAVWAVIYVLVFLT